VDNSRTKGVINYAKKQNNPATNSTGAAMSRFLLLTGVIISLIADLGAAAAGIDTYAAKAPEPVASWCVIRHDSRDQPACYENLVSCVLVALAHASTRTQLPSLGGSPSQDAKQRTLRVVQLPGHRAYASPRHHKLTTEERDELFREFQQWKERSTHE
jgi:hypothetical protein